MMPSATPMLIDDTGQLEASETARFGKVPSAPSRARQHQPAPHTHMDREQSGLVRSSAAQGELLASPRDRIPEHVADEASVRVAAPVTSQSPGTAEAQPEPSGGATPKQSSGSGTAHIAQGEPAATASMAGIEADVRGGEHGLTDREKQELRSIADGAKPRWNIVAGRLRTKRLADRDTAGNWWLTDAGRRDLTSA
jgi:hypothetical protein